MDYPHLFEVLPKPPSTWNNSDVLVWLNYINFNKYSSSFHEKQIDGSCLCMLDEFDLTDQLGITSKINLKKMMKWVRQGLNQYQQYILRLEYQTRNLKSQKPQQQDKSKKQSEKSIPNPISETPELVITYYEGNQSKFYKIGKEGSFLGTSQQCDILAIQETVSSKHVEIIQRQDKYYLRDLGSKYGTFLKVSKKQPLFKGMIIEMGSFQFQVLDIDIENKVLELCAVNAMIGKNYQKYDFSQKDSYCFGRKDTNDFSHEDQHMSGIHAKIYLLNEEFYVEDMQSTNGTWMRISKEYCQSNFVALSHESIFKIGAVSTFICKHKKDEREKNQKNQNCMVCSEKKDCFLLPCRHNITCFSCSQIIESCPLCLCQIQDRIKMFI